jgi:hypothetical protein
VLRGMFSFTKDIYFEAGSVALERQNARSVRVCLDFFFVTFFCVKTKESKDVWLYLKHHLTGKNAEQKNLFSKD